MKTAVVGAGAAGFFVAINLKELLPTMDITLFEKSNKVLSKVEMSGGGRCNCSNTFEYADKLSEIYPRGYRLINKLLNVFGPSDTFKWFENHGVKLTIEDEGRVFPVSGDSRTISSCLKNTAQKYGIKIETNHPIYQIDDLKSFDYVIITTGGYPNSKLFQDLARKEHQIVSPIPSLFTFELSESSLRKLMGISADNVELLLEGSPYRSSGSMLITHWGISGPATLRLSSYAAQYLNEHNYKHSLLINWSGRDYSDCLELLNDKLANSPQKQLCNVKVYDFADKIWQYILDKALGIRAKNKVSSLNKKDLDRLINTLCNDRYTIKNRYTHKEEFVTCGGISEKSINTKTLESKSTPGLYFAGEVLNIDGVTGGYNLQAA